MDIDFKEALELAKEDEEVKESIGKGYYLNSAVGIINFPSKNIKRWIITFYHPEKKEVVQGIVKGGGEVSFKESDEAIDPSENEIDLDKIKTSTEEVIEIALEEVENLSKGISQILVNLRNKEKEVWEISMITKSLSLYKVDVDAETGEVIDTEMETLMKKGSEALPF